MFEELNKLNQKLESKILFNHEIGKITWFKTGGKAKFFIIVANEKELEIIINTLLGYNYLVLGAASNILIRDKGYDGAIIKLGKGFNNLQIHKNSIQVGASILDVNLSKFAKNNSIKNFEFYSGIPGTIGGAIKMNAGCFGSETKSVLQKIKFIDKEGNKVEINADKLDLSYRNSNLIDTDIVTSAQFKISYGEIKYIEEKPIKAKLINRFTKNKNFTRFIKGILKISKKGALEFQILQGQESYKIKPLANSNAWGLFKDGKSTFKKGDIVDCHTTFGINFF